MSPTYDPTLVHLQSVLLGRYHVSHEIGHGGMGIVYHATDLSLDRPVAIKVLSPSLAARLDQRERFLREARTAAGLAHPNIVPVHAVEEHGNLVCFMMGYVAGETLGARVRRLGPLPADQVMRIMQDVAWALAYAHRQGVIHRDIKPDNILLDEGSGRALVTDFGIATATREEGVHPKDLMVVGTPAYMAPEQRRGEPLDGRADIYALGGVAHFALTREQPSTSVVPLGHTRTGLPTRLIEVVRDCLAVDPADRPAAGEAVAASIGEARGRVLPVPPAIRLFLDSTRSLTVEAASYGAIAGVLALEALIARGAGSVTGSLFLILLYAVPVLAGIGMIRGADLVRRARALLKEGHTLEDVMRFAESEAGPLHRSTRSVLWRIGALIGGIGVATLWAGAVWLWAMNPTTGGVLNVLKDALLWAGLTIGPVIAARFVIGKMIQPGQLTSRWSRLMWRVLDWKVFKIAGIGLSRRALPPAAEPTAIGQATVFFTELPEEFQRQLSEVPALLRRLEAAAASFAERERALEQVVADIGEVGSGSPGAAERQTVLGDISAARQAMAGRRQSTMAAIETLRLGLLRLRHGVARPTEITGDVTRVLALADRIDQMLAAEAEVMPTAELTPV